MATQVVDPRWPKILSLTGHELRNSVGVVGGYLRMVLSNRAGPVTDKQRHLLEEAEKGCARLSVLLAEIGQLSSIEEGKATFNRAPLNVRDVLRDTVDTLPVAASDRHVKVELHTGNGAATVHGDSTRLKTALTAVIVALRRELVHSDHLILREHVRPFEGRNVSWIAIGDEGQAAALSKAEPSVLTVFDEWRGGVGLSLVVARRIINAHGASIWSPKEEPKKTKEEQTEEEKTKELKNKASAVIAIPVS